MEVKIWIFNFKIEIKLFLIYWWNDSECKKAVILADNSKHSLLSVSNYWANLLYICFFIIKVNTIQFIC